jgi:predicted esterase
MLPATDWRSHPHRYHRGRTDQLILALHGTGGDEDSLFDLSRRLFPEASILSPRGLVLEGGKWPRFFRRFSEGSLDYEDLKDRIRFLEQWLRAALTHYQHLAEHTRIGALGYSNGANAAAALAIMVQDLLSAAALLRPGIEKPDFIPGLSAKKPTRVLLRIGGNDPICTPSAGKALAIRLQALGHDVEEAVIPNADHELIAEDLSVAQTFLQNSIA